MSLTPGDSLGPYRVLEKLGEGGMGEVYRARDSRLNRDVALKILPAAFATDADRLARFRREAQVLASLSHSNIGHIYGVEDADTTHALVLELIEGPTLADRIARGPLPLDEALPIARQIASALEAAHELGIVHRDLKPANVKVKDDGTVKVLDFGLAKAIATESADAAAKFDVMNSPTLTSPAGLTAAGIILGTAAYMSPEQARGKTLDKRTDIWSFGCVLFEMLSGRRAFNGETVSDTIVLILSAGPDWNALPTATPAGVRLLLERCLERDPKSRLRDLGDARIELDRLSQRSSERDGASSSTASTPALSRVRTERSAYSTAQLATVVLLVVVTGLGVFYATRPPVPVTTAAEYTAITNFADSAVAPSVSPDGRMVTFKRGADAFATGGDIYVKTLGGGEPVRLSFDGGSKYAPAFTPDGSRVTYTTMGRDATAKVAFDTWIVRASGGQPPTQFLPNASGLTWLGDHHLLFAEVWGKGYHMGLVTATESRTDARVVYKPLGEGMAHYAARSPNGQSVLAVEMDETHRFEQPCRLLPFDGGSEGGPIGPNGTCTSAAWSPDGKWMYFTAVVGGSSHVWRQAFPSGAPEQITFGPSEEEDVALAPDGTWLVTSLGTRRSAIWMHDSAGERSILSEGYTAAPRLSSSGTRVFYLSGHDRVLASYASWMPSSSELRVMDFAPGSQEGSVSVLPGISVGDYDISSDETEVVFTRLERGRKPEIWLASLDRRTPPRRIAENGDQVSFGVDGYLVFRSLQESPNKLARIKRDGTDREPISTAPFLDKFDVSPDGRWAILFSSGDGSDTTQGLIAVPLNGGTPRKIGKDDSLAVWSSDGKFFYVAVEGKMVAMPVPAGQSLPDWPAGGIGTLAEARKLTGATVIERATLFPGLNPSMYLFQRSEVQRNLFRIPLHW